MRNPFASNVRRPWLLLCATLLLTYALAPLRRPGEFDPNSVSTLLEIFMFFLSFPLGLVALVFSQEYGAGFISRTQFWALTLSLGYFQWFHLFPVFLRRNHPPALTLNLAAERAAAPAGPAASAAGPPPKPLPDAPPVPQFNERGRTPLERVFDEEA